MIHEIDITRKLCGPPVFVVLVRSFNAMPVVNKKNKHIFLICFVFSLRFQCTPALNGSVAAAVCCGLFRPEGEKKKTMFSGATWHVIGLFKDS